MADLKKSLNVRGLSMIAIGACIGSGIFVTPAATMRYIPHHGYALLAWIIGGIIAFLGAMTFSELGSRFPKEGGVYVYLKEAYGDIAGFLYGWIILLIVNTGALGALGLALADYLKFFLPISDGQKSLIAISILWGLTIINIFGVNISQTFASVFTALKLLAIALIIITGFLYLPESHHDIHLNLMTDVPANLFSGILLAFVGIFWSMGGWHHATYLAGEAIDARRTVPKAMLIGTLTVTCVYVLVVAAYMILLPSNLMSVSDRVAGDALSVVFAQGGKFVSIAISISIFGTIGIYTMTAPRIYYAMAKDGIFFPFLADLSKYGTPYKAMIFQAVWATILILIWGSFSRIITFVTFMDIVFMALATATIFIFRKRGGMIDGYTLGLFPWIPIIYLVVTIAFVINTLSGLSAESWGGLGILLIGIPVYYYFKRKKQK
ncbi:MAG: amino acid permease [Saprospiraceae bacterium]|nr:amino acid permease [Saprospiraceae bacterium]